ncbi:SRPBCC family protein [Pseudoclavibacter sp. JSM 162008]|uniref:SRPBCC family protein n=1 Tax=Pseudoclavibacter sp. JSM 162008 TaxID=3229855 RepID=UPI003523745B
MPQLEASVIVPLSPDEAFTLAHTVGEARSWDPGVVRSQYIRGASAPHPGAHFFTKTPSGRRMILELRVVHAPLMSAAEMVKGPAWLASFGEGWRFEAVDGGTKATWKYTYKLASPVFASTLGAATKPVFDRELKERADAFASRAEQLAAV